MKKQIILIHGGDTFADYEHYIAFLKQWELTYESLFARGWKGSFAEALGEEYEVIAPRMPDSMNAKYVEWKIWFQKLLPFVRDHVVLIGHSLGGIFLAKFLSEETFPRKIRATILIAAPYEEHGPDDSLADFSLPDSLEIFAEQGGDIILYHSKDDDVVPFVDMEAYIGRLPQAKTVIFKNRGHFIGSEFPELVKEIKKLERV